MANVSVIGCGHMGSALIRGLSRSDSHRIAAGDVDPDALEPIAGLVAETTTDPAAAAADAEFVFAALTPEVVLPAVADLGLGADQTLVSTAAGVSTDQLAAVTDARVVRIMPNLAAEWGEMATAVTGPGVSPELLALLEEVGIAVELEESLMDTATALNGSGPAFVFYFIRALQEAAMECGLDRREARLLATQTFKGAAEMVLHTDEELDSLIDSVCTPGGTTIEGMRIFEDSALETTVGEAVEAARERSAELAEEAGDE